MSVSSVTLAIRYTGNGSTSTAYQIPFPFLSPSHVYAAVASNDEAALVLLPQSEYVVTKIPDNTGGSLTTAAAVTAPAEIVIFRQLPLTQPTEFQLQGPFPSVAAETALDRILMQVQQINRRVNVLEGVVDDDYIRVPGGDPSQSVSVRIWQDSAERATVTPAATGQLGIELVSQTIWIAGSTSVGDWNEYRPRPMASKLVLGFAADAGDPGSAQTAIANLFTSWGVDAAIFGGDNSYNALSGYGGGYANDWAKFAPWVSAGKAYPALGNHDLDAPDWETAHNALFPYLPGNRRYYNVVLGGGLVELFVLNSGVDSIFDLQEPDGNTVGSVQHAWFVQAIADSRAKWKIAVFHHPPITLATGENKTLADMDWPELEEMDMILCGHTHVHEILKWRDTMLVNASAASRTIGTLMGYPQGVETATAWPIWADDGHRGAARIVATGTKLNVEFWNTAGAIIHSRSFDNLSPVRGERIHFPLVPFDTVWYTGDTFLLGTIDTPMMIQGAMVSTSATPTNDVRWQLRIIVGITLTTVAEGTILKTGITSFAPSTLPTWLIPRGARMYLMTIAQDDTPEAVPEGLEITVFTKRHN